MSKKDGTAVGRHDEAQRPDGKHAGRHIAAPDDSISLERGSAAAVGAAAAVATENQRAGKSDAVSGS